MPTSSDHDKYDHGNFIGFIGHFLKRDLSQPQWHIISIFTFTVLLLMDKILHQLIGRLSHYLQGFIHHRWCRISSINSIFARFVHVGEVSPRLDISDGEHKHDLGIDWFLCVAGRLAREQKKTRENKWHSARCIFQIYASTQTLKGWQRQSLFKNQKERFLASLYPGFQNVCIRHFSLRSTYL